MTQNYAFIDVNGMIKRTMRCDQTTSLEQSGPGETMVTSQQGAETAVTHYFWDGIFVAFPAQPNINMTWSWATHHWIDGRSLDTAKYDKWQAIKAIRSTKAGGTFTEGGRVHNLDPVAITLAATNAMLAKAALEVTWIKAWTLADNSTAMLTANQVLRMARACDDYIDGLWTTGRNLQTQITAAATLAAVDAVAWPNTAP